MKIRIDKTSEVPVHLQLREQIIFQISTGELPIGYAMPSVRELERRLGIHRNTISQAYAELVEERWLVKERGRRLVVVHRCDAPPTKAESDLEAVIEHLLVAARMRGV